MLNKPLVSVLMTCYNRQSYIATAIESVLASTYSNFELIIVDDRSTDQTVGIVNQFAAKDERIKVRLNERNLGDYPNRNRAASFATGKYVKYVDSDDYIYPNGLEIMVRSMERFPEAGFGLCSLKADTEKPFPFMLYSKEAYQYHFFGPGLFHKGPLDAIFLKSAFDEMGGFKEQRMISDTDMWHRMALRYPVVLMPNGIVWQRRHPEQELIAQKHFIYEGEKIKWKYLQSEQCKLTRQEITIIKKKRLKRYLGFILSRLKELDLREMKTYVKCFWFVSKIKS